MPLIAILVYGYIVLQFLALENVGLASATYKFHEPRKHSSSRSFLQCKACPTSIVDTSASCSKLRETDGVSRVEGPAVSAVIMV